MGQEVSVWSSLRGGAFVGALMYRVKSLRSHAVLLSRLLRAAFRRKKDRYQAVDTACAVRPYALGFSEYVGVVNMSIDVLFTTYPE